jgi:hypothetical protein
MEDNLNVATIPQDTTAIETNVSTNIDSSIQETQSMQPQTFKVKHLHEEKEISFDEAPTYIQKGMDYDRVKSKYEESKPVIGFVEKLAQQNGMTVPEYLKAVEDYDRQQEIESLASQRNLDPELAEELYLLRQDRKQREVQHQTQAQKEKQNQEFQEFFKYFEGVNKRPFSDKDEIPAEVWNANAQGIPLKYAYAEHHANQLESKLQLQQTNQANSNTSTGSVTGNGASTMGELTPEMIENMSPNELMKRWGEAKKLFKMK